MRWVQRWRALAVVAVMLVVNAGAAVIAEEPSPSFASVFFRTAARQDLEAAARLLRENHPGAASDLGDVGFRTTLASSLRTARERVASVDSLESYLALLTGFDVAFGDRHVRTVPNFNVSQPSWVGLIISLQGSRWVVTDEAPWPARPSLRGASLIDCDGRSADDVAQERLGGFRATWDIVAQRGLAAPWLLIDERNPFLKPLKRCTFEAASGRITIAMDWAPILRDKIIERINKASGAGAAGYGLRHVDAGWWIGLQELTENAPAVVAAAQAHAADLRAAPFIVVDVRGNGGGSSAIGDALASILFGSTAAASVAASEECPNAWRVSPDNLARLEAYPAMLGARLPAEANTNLQSDIAAMKAAAAAGRQFSRPLSCAGNSRSNVDIQGSVKRIFILTDRVCFSSCLIVVNHFRMLGAIQIGEPTNANTHYLENRHVPLPSGLAQFGVQAAVDVSLPERVGPYSPRYGYEGDLTDTRAVEQWVGHNYAKWESQN